MLPRGGALTCRRPERPNQSADAFPPHEFDGGRSVEPLGGAAARRAALGHQTRSAVAATGGREQKSNGAAGGKPAGQAGEQADKVRARVGR